MSDNNVFGLIKPFHFYVQKVIPLVYDDALSYLEVLEKVKVKVNEIVEVVNKWQDTSNQYTDEQIEILRQELKAYIDQQDNAIQNLLSNTVAKLNADMDALRKEYQNSEAELRVWVNSQILALQTQFSQFIEQVETQMQGFKDYVNTQDALIYQKIDVEVNRLEDMIHEIELNPVQKVINPVNGKVEFIQETLDSMFYNLKSWGLRAQDYDRMKMSAEEYDNFKLAAWNYDYLGKWYLREKPEIRKEIRDRTSIFSPFQGVVEDIRQAFYEMSAYIRTWGLTAQEYSDLDLTGEEYSALDLTAYEYDWLAKLRLYGKEPYTGLTAEEYDNAQVLSQLVVSL